METIDENNVCQTANTKVSKTIAALIYINMHIVHIHCLVSIPFFVIPNPGDLIGLLPPPLFRRDLSPLFGAPSSGSCNNYPPENFNWCSLFSFEHYFKLWRFSSQNIQYILMSDKYIYSALLRHYFIWLININGYKFI